MKAVIDTCIIVDVLQDRKPFSEDAQKIVLAASRMEFNGVLTAKSISDIYYILRKNLHSESEARNNLCKLFELFEIADTFSKDCKLALNSNCKDYEDAVMIETAKRIGSDCIITRNIKDYEKNDITIYSPAEFLKIL